ncbi:MAG: TIGR03960 family B12-binding radical SAM protein [bacterium]|nr:TIGR03960 family B12-binding radical SAM protein [bacterium]
MQGHEGLSGGGHDWQAAYEAEVFPFVERPSRYIDCEINSVHKGWETAQLRVALVFPDAYEIGISHLGLKLLYQLLNAMPGVVAERCYAPWVDAEARLRSRGIPLCSLESCRPLCAFHIVGFSIQYELCYTNVLAILELGGIPIRSEERWGKAHPLIIAGGNVYAPGPLEPFIDAFAVGDGEAIVPQLVAWAREHVDGGRQFVVSEKLLRDLVRKVPGMYVPGLYAYEAAGDAARRLCPVAARYEDVPFPVRKEIVTDLATLPEASALLVPFCEAVHDRAQIEVMRGCVRGCRFCQAGMLTRPQREKSAAQIVAEVRRTVELTGFEEVTLAALSASDCKEIGEAIRVLLDPAEVAVSRTAVSLPSLRVDSFDPELAALIRRMRKTGFTFAPEAGSERLRRVINKMLTEEEIVATVRSVFEAGWMLVKLYFMLGLPTEGAEDVAAIVGLVEKLARVRPKGNAAINMAVSNFVPKAFTPFQWCGFAGEDEVRARQEMILRGVPRAVKVTFHKYALSRLEAVFARGDRRLGEVVEAAYELGCRFDDWSDRLDNAKWEQAFARCGIDPEAYLAPIPVDERLPWDGLDCGVRREFLRREYERAMRAEPTPACGAGVCHACGVERFGWCRPVERREGT